MHTIKFPLNDESIQYTGERLVLNKDISPDILVEHSHRYLWALQFCKNKKVLDISCGEGYGAFLLSQCAQQVIGIDIDQDITIHAKTKYTQKNISFATGNCSKIPLKDCSIDVVVSFETIEHLEKQNEFLNEIHRVLTDDGIFICSTPNKELSLKNSSTNNIFHKKELFYQDFTSLLTLVFNNSVILGQSSFYGSVILPMRKWESGISDFILHQKNHHDSNITEETGKITSPEYFIALASKSDLPIQHVGIYEGYPRHNVARALYTNISDKFDAKLYIEKDGQFSEAHGIIKSVKRDSYGKYVTLKFQITESQQLSRVRFDPADFSCVITWPEFYILDSNNLTVNPIRITSNNTFDDNDIVYFSSDDPSFIIDLPHRTYSCIEITLKYLSKQNIYDYIINKKRLAKKLQSVLNHEISKLQESLKKQTADAEKMKAIAETAFNEAELAKAESKAAFAEVKRTEVESKAVIAEAELIMSEANAIVKETKLLRMKCSSRAKDISCYYKNIEKINIESKTLLLNYLQIIDINKRYLNACSLANTSLPLNIDKHQYMLQKESRIIYNSKLFDAKFYLDQYTDVANANIDAIDHYVNYGWKEGRNPNTSFNTSYYILSNYDVAISGINPFVHYILYGKAEQRPINGDCINFEETFDIDNILNEFLIDNKDIIDIERDTSSKSNYHIKNIKTTSIYKVTAELFDTKYYISRYDDIRQARIDPLQHYIDSGWKEGRDPCPFFSTKYYLDLHPETYAKNVNPLYCWIKNGRNQNSLPPDNWQQRVLAENYCNFLADNNTHDSEKQIDISADVLTEILQNTITTASQFAIVFSHDNYTKITGGIQLCIHIEQNAFNKSGISYFQIYPIQPNQDQLLESDFSEIILGGTINGTDIGCFNAHALVTALSNIKQTQTVKTILTIHSLIGHSTKLIIVINQLLKSTDSYFWIHDYFSICPSYNLLRNNITFCNAPPVASQACSICIHHDKRALYSESLKLLFHRCNFSIISPSQIALDVWMTKTNLQHKDATIINHCLLVDDPNKPHRQSSTKKINIAFLGYPNIHKGWPTFLDLVSKYQNDTRYAFYHLSKETIHHEAIIFRDVSTSYNNINAMVTAIRDNAIDVVFLWSIWPETFCFTAYEAVAGGAVIITNKDSGNISHLVKNTNAGIIFNNTEELYNYFNKSNVIDLVNFHKSVKHYDFSYSDMTCTLVNLCSGD